MKNAKAEKANVLDVVKGVPIDGTVIWFELNEVDARLLAKGHVSAEVQEQAFACVAWLEDDQVNYTDEDFLKLANKVG